MHPDDIQGRHGDMMELMILGLFNALIIFGINKGTFYEVCHPEDMGGEYCTDDGVDIDSRMVGYKLRLWAVKHLGPFWSKPLFTCPPCMASVWGTVVYWLVQPICLQSLLIWPMYVVMLSGLVALINSVTGYGNS